MRQQVSSLEVPHHGSAHMQGILCVVLHARSSQWRFSKKFHQEETPPLHAPPQKNTLSFSQIYFFCGAFLLFSWAAPIQSILRILLVQSFLFDIPHITHLYIIE